MVPCFVAEPQAGMPFFEGIAHKLLPFGGSLVKSKVLV